MADAVAFTDKPEYTPEETITVTGMTLALNTAYDVPLLRPDRTVVCEDCEDGADACWDTVVADENGEFVYYYLLNGVLPLLWTVAAP